MSACLAAELAGAAIHAWRTLSSMLTFLGARIRSFRAYAAVPDPGPDHQPEKEATAKAIKTVITGFLDFILLGAGPHRERCRFPPGFHEEGVDWHTLSPGGKPP